MFVVTKNGNEVYNAQYLEEMFVAQKREQGYMVGTRLANSPNTTRTLGTYESRLEAHTALSLLMAQMVNNKKGQMAFYMPKDDEVAAVLKG